jgi:hypothetical protein
MMTRFYGWVDEDNARVVRTEVRRADRILSSNGNGVLGESLDLLWKTRLCMRTLDEIVERQHLGGRELVETLFRNMQDLDAISLLFTARTIQGLMISSEQGVRTRAADSRLERVAQRRLEDQLQRANRRFTVLGIALLLPGLWLAYWATPSAPSRLGDHSVSSSLGQGVIILGCIILALAGMFFGRALSPPPLVEEIPHEHQ